MFAPSRRHQLRRSGGPESSEARVLEYLGDGVWRMDDGRSARQAVSCLVTPRPRDRVLLARTADGAHFVLHVLERDEPGDAEVSVPGADHVSLRQGSMTLSVDRDLAMRALGEVELTAVHGPLSLNARNLFASASESLVQTAEHYVGHVEHYLVSARQLLRLDGEQALVTARQDAKIDAERISLG